MITLCEWCGEPIHHAGRADRRTCSKPCRQAKSRFAIERAPETRDRPMHFAYADPPYPGMASRYYSDHPDYGGEVDHAELVSRLAAANYDGWALSTSARGLRDVWALCPPATRLCIWTRPPRIVRAYEPLRAYEALLVHGGRRRPEAVAEGLSDVLVGGRGQRSHPGALVGMKPASFCQWLFQLLGATLDDELIDVFPGSGSVTRAWNLYTGRADVDPRQLRAPLLAQLAS